MSQTLVSGADAGQVRYDLTCVTYRDNVNSSEVKVYFHLHCYLRSSNSYFGYNLYIEELKLNWGAVISGHCVKENSPNKFDFWCDFGPYYVYTTGTSIGGISLNMNSRNNSPSGDWSGGDWSVSCPAYVEPNIAWVNNNISNTTMTSFKVSWSTDRNANQLNYRLWYDNAWHDWTAGQTGINTTSGSFTISGLTHNKYYAVQLGARSATSGNWTNSGEANTTTLSDAKFNGGLSGSFNSADGNPSVNYTNPNGQTFYAELIYGSSNTVLWKSSNITSTSGTITSALTSANRTTLYNQCKSSKTLTNSVRFRLTTPNSTNGSSSSQYYSGYITMNVTNSVPVWNSKWSISDTNSRTTGLTASSSSAPKFIYGYSNLRITIPANATASKNPTGNMDKYTFSATGYSIADAAFSSSAITKDLNAISTNNITVTAQDKRGFTTALTRSNITYPGEFISYSKPNISVVSGDRVNGTGTNIKMSLTATYWNQKFGSASSAKTNAISSIKYRVKQKGASSFGSWVTLTTSQYTISGNSIRMNAVTITGTTFTLGTYYTVEIMITDSLDSTTKQFEVSSGTVIFSAVKGKGMCFGGLYNTTTGGPLQLAGNKVLGFSVESSWT